MTLLYIAFAAALAVASYLFARARYGRVEKDLAVVERSLDEARIKASALDSELRAERQALMDKTAALSEANTLLQSLREKLESQEETMRKEFERLAAAILEEKSRKFTEQNKSNLDLVLNPLKEKIREFEQKVDTAYKLDASERNTLKGEIKRLIEQNQRISEEANNLAVALKGDTRQQGNWGEFILEKVLESSGLEKGIQYRTQDVTQNATGERIKPDVVVYLPEEKHLIIDAKVSLTAYEQMVHAQGPEAAKYEKAHIESLRNHIRILGEKHYHTGDNYNSPDIVMMFLPIESSFSSAMRVDKELFSYAWDRRIVIVSPSTLLATLKTVASIWKQERQTRNAIEIAEEGGKLYDKFVGFVEDLLKLGRRLDDSKREYTEAMNKLTEGSGNLVRRAEKMKKLGAKAQKSLAPPLVERAEPE